MDVKIPKGIKSPTVIIVGSKEPDERGNQVVESRMDNLEKKLDQQYKAFIDKSDNRQMIEKMHSSFMQNFNKLLAMNKSMFTQVKREKVDALRDEFKRKIKSLEDNKDDGESRRLFIAKLNSLENAIKAMTLKPQVVRVNSGGGGSNKSLQRAFDRLFEKMEVLIKKAGPRVIPSPS